LIYNPPQKKALFRLHKLAFSKHHEAYRQRGLEDAEVGPVAQGALDGVAEQNHVQKVAAQVGHPGPKSTGPCKGGGGKRQRRVEIGREILMT